MPSAKTLNWAGWAAGLLPSLMLVFSATMKFMGGANLDEGFRHLGIPVSQASALGVLELSCLLIYLIPRTSVLGAILLTGYLGGAVQAHVRVGDPFVVQVLLGMLFWLGLFLRDARLRALLPWRANP
jgi:hypothetical protein